MSVTSNSGTISAAGQGTTTDVTIGTNTGTFAAVEDTVAGSGTMSNTTVGTNSGTVSAGSISGMSVTSNSGTISAAGAGTISNVTIDNDSGALKARSDTAAGSGALSHINIHTLTPTGTITAASAASLMITNVNTSFVTINVTGNFTATTVGSTVTLSAGHFNVVSATNSAPIVNLVEGSLTRTLQLASHNGGSLPQTFGFYYNGTGSGNPVTTIQVNPGTNTNVLYDLELLTNTTASSGVVAGQGIDLGGLYGVGQAFIRNVEVAGNVAPSGANPAFFGLPTGTPGGVDLPLDTIAVAAAGDLPAGSIVAHAVPAIAFGSAAGVLADNASHTDALVPLATGTALTQANDSFLLFVGVLHDVAQFLVTTGGGSFDQKGLLFGDQNTDPVNKPVPVTATVVAVASGSQSAVQEVDFAGTSAALNTSQPITTTIKNPNGSLGDLILGASGGITANVTAASIVGNIEASSGGISSTIQTTVGDFGRALTDSTGKIITGVTHISTGGGGLSSTGAIISAANLVSQVTIQSGIDGFIFATGDIGVIQRDASGNAVVGTDKAKSLTRFGGITVTTGGVTVNAEIVALGNVFGDINIGGGLDGRLAAKGTPVQGLDPSRKGFLGNINIGGGVSSTAVIVSGGLIGDDGTNNGSKELSQGTQLNISGTTKGIIAAVEDINFGKTGSIDLTMVFENVDSSPNGTVITSIFTGSMSSILDQLGDLTTVSGNLALNP
jgi:hypothetical protein